MVRFILCVRLLTQLKLEGKSERIRIAKNITVAEGIYFPSCAHIITSIRCKLIHPPTLLSAPGFEAEA